MITNDGTYEDKIWHKIREIQERKIVETEALSLINV
jgi:hypothetical protein